MLNFLKKLSLSLLITLTITSCGYYQKLFVDCVSRGTAPANTKYYIAEPSEDYEYLEFQEFSNALRPRLAEIGFEEVDKESADVCINIEYFIGAKEVISSTSNNTNYTSTYSDTNVSSKSSSLGSASGRSTQTGNTTTSNATANVQTTGTATSYTSQFATGGGSSTTTNKTGYPFHFIVKGVSVHNNKPLFNIEMESVLNVPSMASKIAPWLCLIAKWRISKPYTGMIYIQTTDYADYNLPQCFNMDYYMLQYNYFSK